MGSCFAGSLAFTVLYFIAQFPLGSPTAKAVTITIFAMSILLGVIASIFLIRYEFE